MCRLARTGVLIVLLAITASAWPQADTKSTAEGASEPGRLPVRRVVLYKNGVGYFEHSSRVRGTQELNIDFTTAQLNDVLNSLTVVDLGKGRITGVRFNSVAPLEQRLRALRLPLGEDSSRADFLNALRGTRVEVHSEAASAAGRVLSVETQKKTAGQGNQTVEVIVLSIVTDNGDLRSFEVGPATSVHVADLDLNDEVGRYLNLIASVRAQDLRRMTISAAGEGEREIFVSYISEAPVWKSTYRVLLPDKAGEKALMQGWAIVYNTSSGDWKDVRLSLVAGAPQSFIQEISQPYYVHRPVVAMPQSMTLSPQTYEAAEMKEGALAAPAAMPSGLAGGVPGGVPSPVTQTVTVMPPPPPIPPPPSKPGMEAAELASAMEQEQPEAEGKGVGELFEYDIKQNVTIGKNQSALVPILQARIDAEKVTVWNEGSDTARRALWLTNSSGETLDAGSFNVLEGDAFAGEGLLDAVHQDERRLISYAADTAVRIKVENDSSQKPISKIVINKGTMVTTREQRTKKTYKISNSDVSPREVVIEHPARPGWKLAGDLKPEESTESFHRFKVKVDPKQGAELAVEEYHPGTTVVALTNLTSDFVAVLTEQQRVTPAMQQAFRRILDQKSVIAGLDAQLNGHQREIEAISNDQARIRENMKALKGSAEEKALVQRYTGQLNAQEDRLGALRSQIASLREKRQQAQEQLDQTLNEITLTETF